jgi:hypothetical protein
VFGKGAIFGEIALLDGQPRTADATAVTDCALYVIERRDFLPLMGEEPDIALRIIEILCSRLRQTTEQAEEVMFLDLPSRLAKALMRLVDADTAGKRERKISITQRDLGNIIGMSRESINKQLRIWEDKNHKVRHLGLGFFRSSASRSAPMARPRRASRPSRCKLPARGLGVLAVLHTWTQQLVYHPHVHCLVTGGGISDDGRDWHPARKAFLVPHTALAKLLRGKLKARLANKRPDLVAPAAAWAKPWVVNPTSPTGCDFHDFRGV